MEEFEELTKSDEEILQEMEDELGFNKQEKPFTDYKDICEKEAELKKEAPKKEEDTSLDVRELFSWIFTFAAAIIVALFLKNFVIINATVPTGSMENTILPGDDLIGLRFAYMKEDPQRGDIIIFDFPDDETQKYVKRIIGLPGETVYITEGKVYINGSEEPLLEPYLKEDWTIATGPFYFEVPEDSYFVMGDNRNNSYDSRYWNNTFVSRDKITGKAWFIYFPFNRMGSLN